MRVLVVDDDYVSRTKLTVLLSAVGECETAEDGQSGFDKFVAAHQAGEPFDLVTMDINLPDINGQAIVEKMRLWENKQKSQCKTIAKVLMVTMMEDKKSIFSSFETGCQWYLVKPITPDNLKTALLNMGFDVTSEDF